MSSPLVYLNSLGQGLSETVARRSAKNTVLDHLVDLGVRARVYAGTRSRSIVRLHESRVANGSAGAVRSTSSDTSLALLHDNGENETLVEETLVSVLDDGLLDIGDLLVRVLGTHAVPATGLLHLAGVIVPERVPRSPVFPSSP